MDLNILHELVHFTLYVCMSRIFVEDKKISDYGFLQTKWADTKRFSRGL